MDSPLADLFRHNAWANVSLLDACEGLDDAHLDATAPGTYGAVRATLAHLVGSEERYVAGLRGDDPNKLNREAQAFPGIAALRDAVRDSGEGLAGFAETVGADDVIRGTYAGRPYEITVSAMLTQAIHHASEHRAHVVTILSQRGISLPPLDGFTYARETGSFR